jgi:hypothetical protein
MKRQIGLLWIVGFFGLLAAANAQTPSSLTAGAPLNGTYRLVSSAKVNETYTAKGGQMGQCPARKAGPLHIVNGRVRYTSATGYRLQGTVGPQGELTMRSVARGSYNPIEITASGTVDGTGTIRARQVSNACSYDFVWQKSS